ncbi:hypothetical protein A3K29_05850 [Candidatus Collierbacteria bacterium RIFOXYB2_FULL_46_14]|nr:MAG: hypothetical protein A3K29_05850 [Candidatus Collierbacteria bacterium RIFOXYB2_FULL_46_14]OGD76655.1 MAG: hypothetical protein A3K43_05850 [Candidatus Collierbacteria bacterium RIFOXYA2_FULL_46_20]OGD77991.1 MAG: hypothetical protein A3K39_05850 [Candidatus Collierbacteria bacterium RIFOXYC2_FULL_43_15]OGD80015.1 MAG: hypothetical protein A2320_00280 [Pseudomonadales bacterium GWC2_63_15]OGD82713.1 MAG: hypothetical protein A3K36_05850 [Candidatus Collierbacteria bacterium RIFOXYD2_FUL
MNLIHTTQAQLYLSIFSTLPKGVSMLQTTTNLTLNGFPWPRLSLGSLQPTDVVNFQIICPPEFVAILNTNLGAAFNGFESRYEVAMTGQDANDGNNVAIQFIEKIGMGIFVLHTIGLARYGGKWQFMKTTQTIQTYKVQGNPYLFIPSLSGQVWLADKVNEIMKGEKGIPSSSKHVEPTYPDGTIKFWNPFRGFGVISAKEGDVYFDLGDIHRLIPSRARLYLNAGKKVHFQAKPVSGKSCPFKATSVVW